MTEEIKINIENLETEEKTREQARAVTRKERAIRRAYIIGILFLVVSILSDVLNLIEYRVWQIPAESLGDIASLIILIISFISYRRGEKEKAENLLPITILLTYTTGEIFISGSLPYNLLSGLLLFGISYIIFDVKNSRRWRRFAFIHIAGVIIFGINPIIPKFALDQGGTNFVITAGITALLIWQLVQRSEIRSIRVRLMLIMLGLSLTPILISGATSTLIDLQRDTAQVEGLLTLVSDTTSQQIDNLVTSMGLDLEAIKQDPYVAANTDILIRFAPTATTRAQIESGLRSIFRQRMANSDYYQNISLLDLTGEVLVSTNTALTGQNLRTYPGFSSALINQIVLDPYINSFGYAQARLFIPLKDDDGVAMAVLMADINFDLIYPIIKEATEYLGETGEAYLINNQGQLVSPMLNSPEIELGTVISFEDLEEAENVLTGEVPFQTYTNIVGVEVFGTNKTIRGVNGKLVLEQNQEEAFTYLNLSIIINVVISAITLIIAIILTVMVSSNFSAPIEKISAAARRVLQGEPGEFPELERSDEIGTLSNTLNQMTSQLLVTTVNLEQTVAERTKVLERRANYLETTSKISRATTGIYDLKSLLNTVAHLISEDFGFYHVGIFINDENQEYAVLQASNSEGGWKMLARGHKLKIGAQGIVGYVTGTGEPRVQQQVTGEDSVYFDNPDLPLTRSELALPLSVGEEILGALDVQSTMEQAFTEEDVTVLQTLADAVTVSIQNARLVEQLTESLEAERRLFGEITRETWNAMLTRSKQGFSVRSDMRGTQMIASPSTMIGKKAMKEQKLIIGELDTERQVYPAALPVNVRGGATIGVIETQKPQANGPWTQEEINILESVTSELGLALDNARLFEETQRRAQRDRIAADLSTKIWASSDIEKILQTAVSELGSALNVSRGQIRLSMKDGEKPEESFEEEIENIVDGANQS